MPATYRTLGEFLARAATNTVLLTFEQIELIIKRPLPDTAYHAPTWWANDPLRRHANAWLEAGWSVDAVDTTKHSVVFRKTNAPS